jgi:hypothetical protein
MSEIKVNSIKGVGASAAAITVNNTDGTCTANITNNLSNRRLTINGAMEVSQRGTSTTTNGYLIDRFTSNLGGIDQMQFTMSQSTDAPSGFRKSLKFDITTAETGGTGSDEYAMVRYITESQDIAHFLYGTSGAKTITLSFHVKAYQTGTYALNLFVGDSGRSYTANYTISQSATWEKKTLTFVGDTGGSEVNVDNGHGLYINWFMASGTDYKSATTNFNQWAVLGGAQGWAYGHNVDLLNSTDNYFQLAGVQLEVGSVATDFEHRSFGQELALCERYCETILQGETDGAYIANSVAYTTNQMYAIIRFRTPKRATNPTLYQTTGTDYYRMFRDGNNVTATGFTGTSWPNKYATGIYNSMTITAGQAGLLGSDNSNAIVLITSEL